MRSKIKYYESKYQKFDPVEHFTSRIQEMKQKSEYGNKAAQKWQELLTKRISKENYPVVHPIGQETFSLFAEFSSGIYEYAFHIDGATSLIKEQKIKPVVFSPRDIIKSVDIGNINTDPNRIRTNHKNPVIVIQSKYLTNNKLHAINGNHRISEAYKNDTKEIEIYLFNDMEFVPFFYDFLSEAMYFFEIDYNNTMFNKKEFLERTNDAMINNLLK